MNKTPSKKQVISLLHTYDMAPLRRLGQNFLIDEEIATLIVNSIRPADNKKICEIGPGFGALTSHLQQLNSNLTLIEIDAKMCSFLIDQFGNAANIKILHEDALRCDISEYEIIVSNLPYYVTTPLIEKVYREGLKLSQVVFMIQKDVYGRLAAKTGEENYGPLAIMLGYLADISPLLAVKPHSFYPEPPVESLVINLKFKSGIDHRFAMNLDKLVRAIFRNRRKTIANNLTSYMHNREKAIKLLQDIAIPASTRPEQISIEQYVTLLDYLQNDK